jgi:hypothetical protein
MYPDVSMGMAKNQDLSLNPTKVSGLCGRLLCCLSYENEQYRKAKQILPRLGQRITTAEGEGTVVSLQVLKELVTVRYSDPYRDETYPAAELLAPRRRTEPEAPDVASADSEDVSPDAANGPDGGSETRPRRRRRRRNRRSQNDNQSPNQAN